MGLADGSAWENEFGISKERSKIDKEIVKNKLDIIKGTPYLFTCDVTQSDFNYLVNKLDKIHKDLIQMKKVGNCTYVDIDYMLNAIENDKY